MLGGLLGIDRIMPIASSANQHSSKVRRMSTDIQHQFAISESPSLDQMLDSFKYAFPPKRSTSNSSNTSTSVDTPTNTSGTPQIPI